MSFCHTNHKDDFSETYEFPSTCCEAKRVQEDIVSRLSTLNVCPRHVCDIKQALEEAFYNAIKHGNQGNLNKMLRVAFRYEDHEFEIYIEDEGDGFDPETLPDPRCWETLEQPGGRGLLMMRAFMTDVKHIEPGNAVVMVKVCEEA